MYPFLCYPSPFYSVLPSPQFSSRVTPHHSTRLSSLSIVLFPVYPSPLYAVCPSPQSLRGLPLITLYVVPSSVLFLRCYPLPLYIVFPSLSLSLLCFSLFIILASLHSVGRLIGILAHPRTHIFPLAGASTRGKEYSSNEKGKGHHEGSSNLLCKPCFN